MTPRISRRDWLIAATGAAAGAALAGLGADAFVIEPHALRITRHELGSPAAGRPVRIVQLTDLHLQRVGAYQQHVAEAVTALAPDLLVITGDSIDKRHHLPLLDGFLALLDTTAPRLAILGNWEYSARVDLRALAATYARHDCQLLVNESVRLTLGGSELLVTGMDDYVRGRPDLRRALAGERPSRNHLLLAHCPAFRDELVTKTPTGPDDAPPREPDYVLTGHTHGGQVAFFGFAPVRPYGSGRYVKGWYGAHAPPLYVSCGIGTTGLPVRFGVPPEVACFDWRLRPATLAAARGGAMDG